MGGLLRSTTPAPAAKDVAEAEEIAETAEDVLEARERRRIESALGRHAGVAEAVVGAALLGIGEHRVRFSTSLKCSSASLLP